jgi:hypothetical protein
MGHDDGWMAQAACGRADLDPEIFFLKKGQQSRNYRKIQVAKDICQGCPVRQMCLKYAIAHNIRDGIWGGMTVHERQRYFPKAVRAKIKKWWFANHPGARPVLSMGSFTPRSPRGGEVPKPKELTDDYTMALSK